MQPAYLGHTTHNELQCSFCGQWKHRKEFRLRKSWTYDNRCKKCRGKKMSIATLETRMNNGLISEARVAAIRGQRELDRRAGIKESLKKYYGDQNQVTWGPMMESLWHATSLNFHAGVSCDAEVVWQMQFRFLLASVKTKIMARCRTEPAPPNAKLWYDFDALAAHEARKLVAEYPGGPDKCPIIIL